MRCHLYWERKSQVPFIKAISNDAPDSPGGKRSLSKRISKFLRFQPLQKKEINR